MLGQVRECIVSSRLQGAFVMEFALVFRLKACPRCKGDLTNPALWGDRDDHHQWSCVQCGRKYRLEQLKTLYAHP